MSLRREAKSYRAPQYSLKIVALSSLIVILIAALIACLINLRLTNDTNLNSNTQNEALTKSEHAIKNLRFWRIIPNTREIPGHLRTMERVFTSLQYEFVNGSNNDDWDLLWSLDYPFSVENHNGDTTFTRINTGHLRPDQKINHFPGTGPLLIKSEMNEKNSNSKFILPFFLIPQDNDKLRKFVKKNPEIKLVEKNVYNRGVQIIEPKDINYENPEYFYQQFLHNPFLIDGHAFDFGVFVLITSFDPVRVYRYDADVLFRFCEEKYHPFDPKNTNKYVVKEGCLPPTVMPLFEEIYKKYQYPFRKIFETHIEEKGINVEKLWKKIDDAIVSTVLNTESSVIQKIKQRNGLMINHFEIVRYDIIFNENLEPFVVEVNMSPNMTPVNEIFEANSIIYEQMIYEAVKMIGGGSYYEFMARFNESDIKVANSKNIAMGINKCLKYECDKNCSDPKCRICTPCVDPLNHFQMREAFREHTFETNFRRLFPKAEYYDDKQLFSKMTENNQISIEWFKAKCLDDEAWC